MVHTSANGGVSIGLPAKSSLIAGRLPCRQGYIEGAGQMNCRPLVLEAARQIVALRSRATKAIQLFTPQEYASEAARKMTERERQTRQKDTLNLSSVKARI